MAIDPDFGRFKDGGDVDSDVHWPPNGEMSVQLQRTVDDVERRFLWHRGTRKKEQFKLRRRIAYRVRPFDADGDLWLMVPADAEAFRSDLTSVPTFFTWLIPRTGIHLPAALVHDGLVYDKDEPQSCLSQDNRPVTRMQADVVLRDAMADLGTSVARRWLMWAAVTLATIWAGAWTRAWPASKGDENSQPRTVPQQLKNRYYRCAMCGSLVIISVLGIVATGDWFDKWDVLPWMADRPWYFETLYGAAAAIAIPAILSVFWWHLWKAGVIAGVALAFLLHVTIAVLALTFLFQGIEFLTRGRAVRTRRSEPVERRG